MSNAYELLGLDVGATDQQIRSAYRKTALKYHPDKCQDDPKANERFADLVAAFELLKDPERRKELDAKIKARNERLERLKRQSADKQVMIAKLEQRERDAEERQRRRQQEAMSESIRQKIQDELVRFRQELSKEEKREAPVLSSTPSPKLSNTIVVKISRKRKPTPDERDLHDLFSKYGSVVDVVQSKKRMALVSFANRSAMLSAADESEHDYLDSMGIRVSLYESAATSAENESAHDEGFSGDHANVFPIGPAVSPLLDHFIPDDDMSLEDMESMVLGRLQKMAEKQQLKRRHTSTMS